MAWFLYWIILVKPQMMALIIKEKTNRGLSSLEESVSVLLKYICQHMRCHSYVSLSSGQCAFPSTLPGSIIWELSSKQNTVRIVLFSLHILYIGYCVRDIFTVSNIWSYSLCSCMKCMKPMTFRSNGNKLWAQSWPHYILHSPRHQIPSIGNC